MVTQGRPLELPEEAPVPSKDGPKHQNITKTWGFSMFFNASNSVPEAPPERFWAPWGRPVAPQDGPGTSPRDPKTNPRAPKDLLGTFQGAPQRALRSRKDPADDPRSPTVASRHAQGTPKAPK